MLRTLFAFLALIVISPSLHAETRILVVGDSLMTSNGDEQASVSHALKQSIPGKIKSRAVAGARFFHFLPITGLMGMNIKRQYRPGDWDIVVMNGGGNDLLFGCGCRRCDRMLNRLISADGTKGAIPKLVSRIREDGARVIYTGYLRTPGFSSPIERCTEIGNEFEERLAMMAQRDPGTDFISLTNVVPHGDKSFHSLDFVHPSTKGSAAVAERISDAIYSAHIFASLR